MASAKEIKKGSGKSRNSSLVMERELVANAGSVKLLEATCRTRLRRYMYLPVMANLQREGKLLPLKFDERFYEFRSHQLNKSQWPTLKNDSTQSMSKQNKNTTLRNTYVKKYTYDLTSRIERDWDLNLPFQYGAQKCTSCSCVSTIVIFSFCGASLKQ